MIIVRPRLRRLHPRLYGQPEQKVGKVESRVRRLHAVHVLPSIRSIEDKRSARIVAGFGVECNAPEIPAPTYGMFTAIPDQVVGEGPGLIANQLRVRVVQAAEIRERKVGKAPV